MGRPKIKSTRTEVDGRKFQSKREAKRYQELRLLEKAGEITALKCQVRYPIILGDVVVKQRSERYPNGRQISYVADFVYEENGRVVIEDSKGHRTEMYKLKKALMEAMGYEIRES